MENLIIIVSVISVATAIYIFFNRKSVSQLNEQIQDKNAIITALKTHVETEPTGKKSVAKIKPKRKVVTKVDNKPAKTKEKKQPRKKTQ